MSFSDASVGEYREMMEREKEEEGGEDFQKAQ